MLTAWSEATKDCVLWSGIAVQLVYATAQVEQLPVSVWIFDVTTQSSQIALHSSLRRALPVRLLSLTPCSDIIFSSSPGRITPTVLEVPRFMAAHQLDDAVP